MALVALVIGNALQLSRNPHNCHPLRLKWVAGQIPGNPGLSIHLHQYCDWEGFIWQKFGKDEIQPSLMPQSWFTRDEKEARQISVEIRFLLERRLISMGKWNSKKISMGKWKISMKKLKEDFHEKLKEDSWADARTSHAIENWQNNWL